MARNYSKFSLRLGTDLATPVFAPFIASMSEVTRTHLHNQISAKSSLRDTSKARAIPTSDAKVLLVRPRSMSWRCFGSRCARSESFSWDRPQLLRNSRMRLPSLTAITRTAGEARAAERHFRPSALLRGDGTYGALPWPHYSTTVLVRYNGHRRVAWSAIQRCQAPHENPHEAK